MASHKVRCLKKSICPARYNFRFVDALRIRGSQFLERLGFTADTEDVDNELDDRSMQILTESLAKKGVELSENHFAGSEKPRDPKSPEVMYSVGQVSVSTVFKQHYIPLSGVPSSKIWIPRCNHWLWRVGAGAQLVADRCAKEQQGKSESRVIGQSFIATGWRAKRQLSRSYWHTRSPHCSGMIRANVCINLSCWKARVVFKLAFLDCLCCSKKH